MSQVFDFLFSQYSGYSTLHIVLEVIAVIFSIISVVYSLKNKIWVFPTGIVGTSIFVYLLFKWELLGDMIVNLYYFIMSIYGWYLWSRKDELHKDLEITSTNKKEKLHTLFVFTGSILFIYIIYTVFNKWNNWTAYVDTFTTGLFFSGMWLLAKRKLENWILLLIGNVISIPLYFIKGYTLSSFLYVFFTIMAILGYIEWKKILNNKRATV